MHASVCMSVTSVIAHMYVSYSAKVSSGFCTILELVLILSVLICNVHSEFCMDCNGSVHDLFQVRALQVCNGDLGQLTVTGLWKYIL